MATTVKYNGSIVATVEGGNTATLPVKDLNMKTDIVITVPEGDGGGIDSPLPIAVSTEAEMTALLTSGEVGGVYKYVGASGTYENGALYVLEEEAVLGDITITAVGKAHQYSIFDGSGAYVSGGTIASGSLVHLTNIESGGHISLTNTNVVRFSNAVNCSYDDSGIITDIGVGASITATYSNK